MARNSSARQLRPGDSALEYEQEDIELDAEDAKAMGDLADLDAPGFADWEWNVYRLRTAEEMARSGTRSPRVWITKRVGPINLNEIHADYGGGWFEFWGKQNGVTLRKFRRELEGEPKLIQTKTLPAVNQSVQAPNGAALSSAPVDVESAVRRAVLAERRRAEKELERREREAERRALDERLARLEQLIQQAATAPRTPAGKSESLKELMEVAMMMRSLSGEGAAGVNPLDLLKSAREWMEQGILLGEKREPGDPEGGAGWNAERVSAIAQSLAQILTRFTPPPRRPGGPPPPTPAGPTTTNANGSSATVVDAPAAATPAHRYKTAIEAVARGMVTGKDPADIADSLEDMLDESEVMELRTAVVPPDGHPATAAEVLEFVRIQHGIGPFPQLESPGGKVYMDSVLTALRTDDDGK